MIKNRVLSFKYAFSGLITALKDEPNLKIHFLVAFLVILLGVYLQITRLEWILITSLISLVVSLELTNTAMEELINSFVDKVHPSAKKAKDVAAAAVLMATIAAVLVGLMIFVPYFLHRYMTI